MKNVFSLTQNHTNTHIPENLGTSTYELCPSRTYSTSVQSQLMAPLPSPPPNMLPFIFEVFKFRKGIPDQAVWMFPFLKKCLIDGGNTKLLILFFLPSFAKKDDKGMFATLGPVLAEGQDTVLILFFVLS